MKTDKITLLERAKKAAIRVRDRQEDRKKMDRGPVTIYLSKSIYKAFQKEFEETDLSASQVVEEMMEEFCTPKGR